MSTRKIVVYTCDLCPHQDRHGRFGHVAYVPVCSKAHRELPYSVHKGHGAMFVAKGTGVIPDWCPLEVNDG